MQLNISTVDPNHLSIDPLCSISGQESHQWGHILRLPQPSQRTNTHHPLHVLLSLPRKEHVRRNGPRRHAIRRDLGPPQLLRQYLRHRLHSRVRRRVSRIPRAKRRHLRRCEADDPPTPAAHQAVGCLLGAVEGALDVDGEGVVPVLLGGGGEGGVLGVEDAGAVDEDVGLGGEGRLGLVEEGFGLEGDGAGGGGGGADLGGEEVGLGGAGGVVEDEVGAEGSEVEATVRPMPLEAPVTMSTRPWRG
ncbi:hypothetical protein AAC387_Pa05g3037 [Persea americana]